MQLKDTSWVCMVDPAVIAEWHQKMRQTWLRDSYCKLLAWRQIRVTATAQLIRIELMNVDEEAASGGYWRMGSAHRGVSLTWDDLNDVEFMQKLFAHEQVCVMTKATEMLAKLREHMRPLRLALAA